MQHIPPTFWQRAREVLAAERGRLAAESPGRAPGSWSALHRLYGELSRQLDPYHARALLELGLGLARPNLPSLQDACITEEGDLCGASSVDDDAAEAVLACVFGLLATLDGPGGLEERLTALWPRQS